MLGNQPLTRKRIILIISLFTLLLTSLRFGWMIYHKNIDYLNPKNGKIDLSDLEVNDNSTITLDGEWEYYPNEFIDPEVIDEVQEKKHIINVPGDWSEAFPKNNKGSPYRFGTYRLKITLPEKNDQLYGIRIKEINSAAHVFINGKLQEKFGLPSTSANKAKGYQGPLSTYFQPDNSDIDLVIHVSNFDLPLPYGSGITDSVEIGTLEAIQKVTRQSTTLQAIIGIVFLLHAAYAFTIYYLGRGKFENELFYFGLMLSLHGITILIDDDIVLQLPINVVVYHKLLHILFISTLFSLLIFIRQLFQIKSKLCRFLTVFHIILTTSFLFTPIQYIMIPLAALTVYYLISLTFLFFHTIKSVRLGYPDAVFILLFLASYTSNMIWGALINAGLISIPFYPFDFLISIIAIALLLFKKHIRIKNLNEEHTKQLQKIDKLRGEFLANTSHELRNPLHGIINIAESVLERDKDKLSENSNENLALLINIGKRMSFTLNDLNTDTQLREGKMKLNKSTVSLHVTVSLVIDLLHFMKQGKNIRLYSTIPPDFPKVLADENRLIQILFNLIHNAIKYTDEGSIKVEADYKKDLATIYVKDTGVGISSDHMEKIFKRYERAHSEVNMLATGIGIGLSVTKQLVELHGGMITYESTSDGTTFLFTIPLANQKMDEKERQTDEQANINYFNEVAVTNQLPSKNETENRKHLARILIIDDDSVNINILYQLLINDYQVETALSGKEAIRIIDKEQIDLVISDVMMPYMSGYELTKILRKKYTVSELPILLITARHLPEDIEVAFTAGANDYLIKPVNARELKARVMALTKLKQSVTELLCMEAAWLQAQIHPHFLYNTLNSIASLAEIDNDRMIQLLEAFGNYLQKSFSIANINNLVSLTDELDLTTSYIHIEKERFGKRLKFEYEIDNNIEINIPPLSIQPLVENAIMHGILQKSNGGTVRLKIKEYQNFVEVTIEDNGVGMSQEKIRELLNLEQIGTNGVGIKNTNKRLVQRYGKGLEIKSIINEGTIVKFQIPKGEK